MNRPTTYCTVVYTVGLRLRSMSANRTEVNLTRLQGFLRARPCSFGSYATYAQPDSPDAYCMEMTYVIGLPDITTANQTSTEVLEKVKAHAKRNEPGMAWLEVYRAIKGLSHKKDIPNEIETVTTLEEASRRDLWMAQSIDNDLINSRAT
ncbi:hypothetical protein TREMEDRAFT_65071 [Tremella mesenterica DSM 1558]|uniref:uncharacterized protein n=1 Tax=Tremella mesenterica (strain ATCC 24925 / CBS 8224 / DSM 1558 / NBRC 9311 / NRRL Y-6157 / RJB 2259-6 / UBC 559-6) TaxID=578456 RepID=UPI00032BB4A5|nr:uncharacterized protein TREMEDRAFT_65071 [Tremella mesenterica DSM 1558]EIW66679.1 hypothetical protein TREMEDRAFT_65071 [Tremella mesenterica DSM 1558]